MDLSAVSLLSLCPAFPLISFTCPTCVSPLPQYLNAPLCPFCSGLSLKISSVLLVSNLVGLGAWFCLPLGLSADPTHICIQLCTQWKQPGQQTQPPVYFFLFSLQNVSLLNLIDCDSDLALSCSCLVKTCALSCWTVNLQPQLFLMFPLKKKNSFYDCICEPWKLYFKQHDV